MLDQELSMKSNIFLQTYFSGGISPVSVIAVDIDPKSVNKTPKGRRHPAHPLIFPTLAALSKLLDMLKHLLSKKSTDFDVIPQHPSSTHLIALRHN